MTNWELVHQLLQRIEEYGHGNCQANVDICYPNPDNPNEILTINRKIVGIDSDCTLNVDKIEKINHEIS